LNNEDWCVDIKKIFSNGHSNARRMLILIFVASSLILIDTTTQWLKPIRTWFSGNITPVYSLALFPNWADELISDISSSSSLKEKNKLQNIELLILKARLQKMAELSAENLRLRNLLYASELLKNNVLVAELIGLSPDPLSHTILINRGKDYGVIKGQAILDSEGLMGQVIEVYKSSSKVLLISDSLHAMPVKISRNGVRFVAEGSGNFRNLTLRYVSPSSDIIVGDLLVSSGLGKRYPAGYPVGWVTSINPIKGGSYLNVNVKPTAQLDRSRYLLLVTQSIEKFKVGQDEK